MNAFLCQIIDDYCILIPKSFPLAIFHMLSAALILFSLLLHKFLIRFAHGITFGFLLLFQFPLYIYRHADISSFYLLFLSWYNFDAIFKVISSLPLLLTNQRHHYQNFYDNWWPSICNHWHQWTSPLRHYPDSWAIIYTSMTFYNGLTHPVSFFLDALCTNYHRTLSLDKLLDLSPSVYWHLVG